MLHGLIPYRDLYEQKGPLLYMLHALAAIVSERTFLGVYFLEIIAAVACLIFSFKIMKLYRQSTSILVVAPLAAVVYSAACFCHGDSAEELCLPLFSFSIYLVLKLIRQGQCPTRLECMAVGATSAFVLWMKYSLLGFYFGWFFVVVWLLISRKSAYKIISVVGWIIVGIMIPTVPILAYFGVNHALWDLWTVYFYNNLFCYSSVSDHFSIFILLQYVIDGIENVMSDNLLPTIIIGFGIMTLMKKKDKTELYACLAMAGFTFVLVYLGGQCHLYYAFIFNAFAPIGIMAVYQTLCSCFSRCRISFITDTISRYSTGIICAGSVIFAFIMCSNTYLLKYRKSDLPQYHTHANVPDGRQL